MGSFFDDCRYAVRMFLRVPGFTLTAVLALALGIGANSAIFSIINAVVLKPLSYEHPEQLVQLWMRFTGIGIPNDQNAISPPEFVDLQENQCFSSVAAFQSASFNINIDGTPERIDSARVSPAFFSMLGVHAQLGRAFLPEEGQPGRANVVLLSDGLWRRRFGADPAVPGRKLVMNGESFTITGVLPRGFQLPEDAELWTPLVFSPGDLNPNSRGSHNYQVIARIRPGLTLEQAHANLEAVSNRIIERHPEYPYRQFNFKVLAVPLLQQQVGDIKTALWVLMAAVGLVLLIACANVANLLLVRASAREREIAVRQALGVSRSRLIRQLLTESGILALSAGAIGLILGYWALHLVVHLAATSFPRVAEARMDLRVLAFALLLSMTTGMLFGLAPAFASRSVTHDALKEGGRGGSAGLGSQRLRGALVIAEVALSLTLLVGAGLLIRSFLQLQDVDGGFRASGVLTMRISLPNEKYSKPEQTRAFYRELMRRIRMLPGVDAAGGATGLPLTISGWSGTTTVDSREVQPRDSTPEADQRPVLPGYFEAMGIPLVRGRYFDQRDNEAAAPVAIIDETMANTYWRHEDPIGKRIRPGGLRSTSPWFTIVGVVRPVRYRTLESPSRVEFYWPYDQTPFALGSMSLTIHTSADPKLLARAVEREVLSLDPNQPVYRVRTMTEIVSESMSQRRLSMALLSVFAGLALILAGVGIYGVVSYSVAQRAHEVGIRLALGANRRDVVRMVLAQGLGLTLAGIAAGLLTSVVLTGFLSALLFNTKPADPETFGAIALILLAVALLASFLPAYRATTVDPIHALRQE
ncbi:MAG TPA: ABC transporter permease [Bryobacteraceae bacterium]|nr:ABC transporter permease [Bryobacteraceae bacterium]